MNTQESVEHLIRELKGDSSYFETWKANIAMAFVDEYDRHIEKHGQCTNRADVHGIANNAAGNFLNTLMKS